MDGSEAAEAALRETVEPFFGGFPDRVRAVYVEGSQADGTALATSDLDVAVVFAGAFRDEAEKAAADAALADLAGRSHAVARRRAVRRPRTGGR
jgi:predicted nucleotidyltransferase